MMHGSYTRSAYPIRVSWNMFRSEIGMRPKEKEWQVDVCETPARLIADSWMFLNKATTTSEDSVSPFAV